MKKIDYTNKENRKINGMYFVFNGHSEDAKNYEDDQNAVSVVFSPEMYPVAPALDYLKTHVNPQYSKGRVNKEAKAICHWYNFLGLHRLTGKEEVTTNTLIAYIKYLASLPKHLNNRISVHPSELELLPVHPYIEGVEDENTVKKIYKEWFTSPFSRFKAKKEDTVTPFYKPNSVKVEVDVEAWRYSYEQIEEIIKYTLEYLWWLGESEKWSLHFMPINKKVARREIAKNQHNNNAPYVLWKGYPSINKHANLKRRPVRSIRGERIFFESELRSFLQDSKVLGKEGERKFQRKFFFILLLLTGMRVSECLNLLVKDIRITLPTGPERYQPFSNRTIVHWEDMFIDKRTSMDRMDVRIDKYLNFIVWIQKRDGTHGTFNYESKRRKNKSVLTRETKLQDVFSLPELLGLQCESIFVTPKDYNELFKNEIRQKKMEENMYKLAEETISYYLDSKKRGIDISDSQFEMEHKIRIQKIRSLINNSWFGNLFRNYLIERHLLQSQKKLPSKKQHYLFVNPETKNAEPYEPQTPLKWLKQICGNQGIKRSSEEEWGKKIGHKIKNSITLHSFRHTYVSARIGLEQSENRYQPANLKRQIGHVPNSNVTETVYYWEDRDLKREAQTALYRYLEKNQSKIKLEEQEESNIDAGGSNNLNEEETS